MASGTQTLRFRRPDPPKPAPPKPNRHTGILQDQLRRAARKPWVPDFQTAVQILLLVRVAGAMYSNIQDCDEVFNFWEPLHFLQYGHGFQTWEVTPTFAIRSWAYILLHMPAARLSSVLAPGKRPAFFAPRIFLAVLSTVCEVKFYRTVVEKINDRVGRYLFFTLLFNAGMWNAASAFLPSSFAMYATTLAFAFALEPSTIKNTRRTLCATMLFATGAIVGWPFALALSLPFVIEELFVLSGDKVDPALRANWMLARWRHLIMAGLVSALIFVPMVCIDSVAYGKWTIVPWNIVQYNIFGGSERGPDLYGTSPWYFYILNLFLNFNILLVLAFASLPSLAITYHVDRKRLGLAKPGPNESSPFTILAFRLAPLYLWASILTSQAHKEERFMFPAYPLICFNAAVTIYLLRGWLEVTYIYVTKSPYKASKSNIFSTTTLSIILVSGLLSISRILALWHYYHAPLSVFSHLEAFELPRLLNDTGLLPPLPAGVEESDRPSIDLTALKQFDLKLCLGKEWHRFPGHYLVPNVVSVDFVKSDFEGLLPAHFRSGNIAGEPWWDRKGSKITPADLNDLNKEVQDYYVPVENCDYLVDLDFPQHPTSSGNEPRYAVDEQTWERVTCLPFLDASQSSRVARTLWVPGRWWQSKNEYGDYCLLKNRERVGAKERDFITRTYGGK
ncbi:glycosyltransferase family 22 protein [Boletus edulis BED1]|uniref:Mannosyltransferase n=1 Tax=Boletus edulis BED1 TaxID=1328754 RepID=A0AAD4C1P3_BOLED|nr:glycosyltransferase family 22 protein [Boletus edulis BED1]